MPEALIIDDDDAFSLGLCEVVSRGGYTARRATSLKAARAQMEVRRPDLIFVDLHLPDGKGLEMLGEEEDGPDVVLITGQASIETAIEALRLGATDYIVKPVDLVRVRAILANVAKSSALRHQVVSLRTQLRGLGHFGALVGTSPPMQKVYDLVARVATTEASVLVTGETGTGKELVAQSVHELSRRRKGPFIALNCGAVTATLIESEVFGHERGSFTGADRQHKGAFERAHGGTLFLDEVTEMPVELQVKLLRVLESRQVQRVGGSAPIPVDVRVVAATNRDPMRAVEAGKLREDLYYRLNVFPIELPPLRTRGDDVALLATGFAERLSRDHGTTKTLAAAALQKLQKHTWPGNVRQLKNAIERAFILAEGQIGPELFELAPTTAERRAT